LRTAARESRGATRLPALRNPTWGPFVRRHANPQRRPESPSRSFDLSREAGTTSCARRALAPEGAASSPDISSPEDERDHARQGCSRIARARHFQCETDFFVDSTAFTAFRSLARRGRCGSGSAEASHRLETAGVDPSGHGCARIARPLAAFIAGPPAGRCAVRCRPRRGLKSDLRRSSMKD
jgi:hypothetical protein